MQKQLTKYLILLSILLFSCEEDALPKPWGYPRLEYDSPVYKETATNCGYSIQTSHLSRLVAREDKDCWYDLAYPSMDARVHLSYFSINNNLDALVRNTERLTYEHTIKASSIKPKYFENPDKKVYAIIFYVGGNSASNVQFYATDSLKHFLSGSLYFNTRPKPDSLQPAIDYMTKDIEKLIETLHWEN